MSVNTTPETGYGEIFDRGYAHYDGDRRGRRGAITSLIGYSMKRAMGIRKSWTAKVMPFILYIAVTIPMIVMVAVISVFRTLGSESGPSPNQFASYSLYFVIISTMVGLFVAIGAPEMICVDRHERTLPLYFSRAINRGDYVFAKIAAMSLLTMTMTALPASLFWLGRQLTEESARQAMVDHSGDLLRVLLLGFVTSLMYATVGLMISSLTNRKGVAIALILISFLVVTGVAQSLSIALQDYQWSRWLLLGDVNTLISSFSIGLFHDDPGNQFVTHLNLGAGGAATAMIGITLVAAAILRWRYVPRDDA